MYHLLVTVTLTSDLVFRKKHVRSFSLILLKVGIPNLVCGCHFSLQSHIPFSGHFDLDL